MSLMDMVPPEAIESLEGTAQAAPKEAGDEGLAALFDPQGEAPLAPLTVGELPAFLRAAKPILAGLAEGRLVECLQEEPEALIAAVCVGARVDRAWLEAQTPDVLIDLAAQVLGSNTDFFIRRLTPALDRATRMLERMLAGPTSPAP